MPDIMHLLRIGAPPEQVYARLTTTAGVAAWWTADAELEEAVGGQGVFRFHGAEHATAVRIEALEQPTLVRWRVTQSFRPEWLDTAITFALATDGDATTLRFAHRDFPQPDDDYALCTTGWGFYLNQLKDVVERP